MENAYFYPFRQFIIKIYTGVVIMEQIKLLIDHVIKLIKMHAFYRLEYIEPKDVVDIVLLSIVFYFVFKFIINKRAARLALGLVFIGIIMLLSWLWDMRAMMFIFRNFTQVGIMAIIIMFQPELRSALEKIGNAPLSNFKGITGDPDHINNTISTLTETACDLSLEKTGALIVIERSTKLGEHIKTGTVLNAQLSSKLLKTVFFDKAPMHDGAVIIRNNALYSAGCFLPLSLKEDIDEKLGTRHRAAIGITEVSDAIAIVVSEETGNISIACDGKLKQNYSYKSLHKELSELLIPNNSQTSDKHHKRFSKKQKEAKS